MVPQGECVLFSSSGCPRPSKRFPSPNPRPHPYRRLLPPSRVGTRGRPAPPLLFPVRVALRQALYSSPRRRRARPARDPASPFKCGPKSVSAPRPGLSGAIRWAPKAPLCRTAAGVWVRAQLPALPNLGRRTELPEAPKEALRKESQSLLRGGGPRPSAPSQTLQAWALALVLRLVGSSEPRAPFPGIPGPWSWGCESAPQTPRSLGSGFSGFSETRDPLGAQLAPLPLGDSWPRGVSLWPLVCVGQPAAPAAICTGVGDFEIFHSPPRASLTAAGPLSGLHAKPPSATSRMLRGARVPLPGTDLVGTLAPLPSLHPRP